MCLTRLWSILFLPILLIACSSQSSTGQIAKDMQTATSWTATARMVSEAWMKGNVPIAYTQRTLQAAQQSLQEEVDKLAQSSKIPPDTRRAALELLRNIKKTLGKMQSAVKQGDRIALTKQINQLDVERQKIPTLTKRGERS